MFFLSAKRLEDQDFRGQLANPAAGACVTFEGRVRNRNRDRKVVMIEYEATEGAAVTEFGKIADEIRHRFEIFDILCVHRTGKVQAGELAVWVGVTAEHRQAAFEACQYAITELKQRLPIWKKEYYADGTAAWLGLEG